ncbi:hypothetical protein [Lactobacillus crispatus]|nr:hypothetical protein [Lactobacillus crispatus]
MKNFKVVNNIELNRVVGGKIIRLTPYMLYNTKTHKTIPDYGAI